MKENVRSTAVFQRLTKADRGALSFLRSFASQLTLYLPTQTKLLYDGKIQDPRHSSAADKALRCLILNPGTAN